MKTKLLILFAFLLSVPGLLLGQTQSPTDVINNTLNSGTIFFDTVTERRLSFSGSGQYIRELLDGVTYTFLNLNSADANADSHRGGAIRMRNNAASQQVLKFYGSGTVIFDSCKIIASNGPTGGAIANYSNGIISFSNVIFRNNYIPVAWAGEGGAIYMRSGTINITHSGVFEGNYATTGGALWVGENALVEMNNTLFISNTAFRFGGAIMAQSVGDTRLTDAIFTNNFSGTLGGALYLQTGGTVTLNATKDVAHVGNWTSTGTGGFAHFNTTNSFLNLNAADGVTVTIGSANDTTKDGISASINTVRLTINAGGAWGGDVILNANSSAFTGTTNVEGGRLLLGNSEAKLGGFINVASGATFGGQGTVDVRAGGSKNVTLAPDAVLQVGLDGASGQSQTLALTGELRFSHSSALTGDGILDVTNSGTTILNGMVYTDIADTKTVTISGGVGGTGGFWKLGAGTLELASDNTFGGPLYLYEGTLLIGANAALGSGTLFTSSIMGSTDSNHVGFSADALTVSNNIVFSNYATFDTGNFDATLSGDISGAAGFRKEGAGTLTLVGDVSYTGTTSILGGTLAGDISTSRAVVIANQSVLAGDLTRAFGQTLAISSGTIVGNLTLDRGRLYIDLRSSDGTAGTYDAFSVTGAFVNAGTPGTPSYIDLSNFGSALQYTIFTAGDLTNANLTGFHFLLGGRVLGNRASPTLSISGDRVVLTANVRSLMMKWTGGASASPLLWDMRADNWLEEGAHAWKEIIFRPGDHVVFEPAASAMVDVASAGVLASDVVVNVANASGVHTFTGGAITTRANSSDIGGATGYVYVDASVNASGSIASTGKFTKEGVGTLTFANAGNDFTGGLDINAGIVSFNRASQLLTTGTTITFAGSGTLRADANILGSTGTLATNIAVAAAGAIDTQAHTIEYTGVLTSGNTASSLAKLGGGTLLYRASDSSDYTGAINVNQGIFLLADSASLGGTITIARGALAGGKGTFSNNVFVSDGGVLRVGTGDADALGGAGTLNINGGLTLTGSARVNFRIFGSGSNDTLNVGGAITTDNSTNIVSFHYGSLASGTYFLGQAAGLGGITNIMVNESLVNNELRARYDLGVTSGTLFLFYGTDDSRYMQWTGAAGVYNWNPATANWEGYNGDTSGETYYQDGDTVRFATSGNVSIAIDSTTYISDMVVDNTGALTFTGEGIAMDTSIITGTLITNPGSKLVKAGAGALIFDNDANYFPGGIDLTAGVLAFSNTSQIDTAGAAIRIAGAGTLRANASMDIAHTLALASGVTGAFDTGANTVTFTGALAGPGVLVKLGDGGLVYSGLSSGVALLDAAATTRIDAGCVVLRDFTAADIPVLAHNFIINGGWLDLSDATGFDRDNPDASIGTNDWASLNISGSLGGVISSNDKITLRNGNAIAGIGSPGDSIKQGVYIVVDAGANGIATMTGANSYAGSTVLLSGTLRVSTDNQLGLASLNREIRFEGPGAALEITANGYTSTRAIELREDGNIGVIDGATATWGGVITGESRTLSKTGTGTLVLTGSNDATLKFNVAAGTLQGNATSLRNDIATAAGATVAFAQETGGTYGGIVSGAGTFEKRGAGVLTMTKASALTGATRIVAGTLKVGADNLLSASSAHSISSGASLDMRGTQQTIASLDNEGVIHLTADVNSRAGIVSRADQLVVNGAISGAGTIDLTIIDLPPTVTTGSDEATLISGLANTSDFNIVINGGHITDVYGWAVEKIDTDYVLTRGPLSPLIPGVVGIDAAVLLSTQSAFDALGQRLGAMRLANGAEGRQGFDVWLNGIIRRDEISEALYDGTTADTQGLQAGFDYTGKSKRFAAGLFADYITTDMTMPGGKTKTDVTGYGAYITMRPAPEWYVDVLLRAHSSTHTVSLPGVADFDMDASGFGVSVMYGYQIKTSGGWNVEPQVQLTWHRTSVDETFDPAYRLFKVDTIASFRARVGGQVSKQVVLKSGALLNPYVRAGFIHELEGNNNVVVMQYTDETRQYLRNRYDFDDNFGGASGNLSAGMTLRIRNRFDAWIDAGSTFGGKMESYGINLGVAFHW